MLNSIEAKEPSQFKALLMPCLHSPELYILKNKGVPSKNLVGIEKHPETWKKMKKLRGLDMGPAPMDANDAMDSIIANHPKGFDLIYLDFFSRIWTSHMRMLQKMMHFRMIRPGGKLIMNFGRARTQREVKQLNDMLLNDGDEKYLPTKRIITSAMEITGHPLPIYMQNRPYKSNIAGRDVTYVTTEAQF